MLIHADLQCECGHVSRLYHLSIAAIRCAGCGVTLPIGEPDDDTTTTTENMDGEHA